MAIDPADLANLLSLQKPAVAAYWYVQWDPLDSAEDRYYSDAAYHEVEPFQGIGVTIQPKIIGNPIKDGAWEINPDLKTEKINITFDNIIEVDTAQIDPEENIQNRFQLYKSGVRCELFYYYPNPGANPITVSVWGPGTLQAPDIYGLRTVKTTATNGYRSREQKIPRRTRPRECTANFGAWMPNYFALESNGCPYDRHLGGSIGTLNPDTGQPWLDCPRDSRGTCDGRLGTTGGPYFLGFDTTTGIAYGNLSRGEIYISKGNTSALKEPIRVIAGTKYLRGLQVLAFRRERDNNHPVNSFISGVLEVAEGPNQDISNVKVKDKVIEPMHLNIRLGALAQPASAYGAGFTNLSGTAHIFARYGWIDLTDPTSVGPGDMEGECQVTGYSRVAVFTDSSTYTRIWTNNRVWWLMELMTNQRWGLAYASTKFEIDDWIDRADWADQYVKFTAEFIDGETIAYQGQRTVLEAALEGRAVAEQIEDICRSGALSVPFQHEGKFTLSSFEAITDDQRAALRTFTDAGENKNIIWGDGQPNISVSQTPDDKVVNEVVVTFEEDQNTDIARPVTVDDPNQKLRAGRALGENNLQSVPKQFSAFGIRTAQEAVRLAHRLLRFGEFDEGGTQNNLKLTFTTPFEQTLGLKRYGFIRIESPLLNGFEIGTGDFAESPEIFRILRMKKMSNGVVEMTCQAYNDTAYLAMDVFDPFGHGVDGRVVTIREAGSPEVNEICYYVGDVNARASYSNGAEVLLAWSGTAWEISYLGTVYYSSPDDVDTPWTAVFEPTGPGIPPRAVVFNGIFNPPPGCDLTTGAITYNATLAQLSIPIPPC